MIRRPTFIRTGGGEREEIGRIRQVDRQAAKAVERFDPEGGKSPGGEWRRQARQAEPGSGSATGPGNEAAVTGAIREAVVEPKAERAWKPSGRKRRSRLGAETPKWEQPKGGSCCGRAKGRYERPVPDKRQQAASREALIRGLDKTAIGEQRGESSGAFVRSAPCRACR